ncbi:hypothetical protein ACFL58_04780, partial [Elusimicrobiota bacterium]
LEEMNISVLGTSDYYTSYFWRGQTLDMDPVLQNGITLYREGITAYFWSSMPVSDKDSLGATNEVDFTLSYTKNYGYSELILGHITYQFPFGSSTNEIFVTYGINDLPVLVQISYYNDYSNHDGINGMYYCFDIGKSFPLQENIMLNVVSQIGSYSGYGAFDSGTVLTLGFSTRFNLTEKLSVKPLINYVSTAGNLADASIGNNQGGLYGGFSVEF